VFLKFNIKLIHFSEGILSKDRKFFEKFQNFLKKYLILCQITYIIEVGIRVNTFYEEVFVIYGKGN